MISRWSGWAAARRRLRPRRLSACGPARHNVAEREGFEHPRAHHLAVFKTAALNHSATSPARLYDHRVRIVKAIARRSRSGP